MELSELNPFPVVIEWEGQEIELRSFDLKAITWADWFFDVEDGKGFSKMNENLSSPDPNLVLNTILDIVYHLAEGIDESVSEFKKSVINGGFHNLNPAIDQATEYLAGVTDRERFSAFSPILEEALELKSKLDAYNVADKVKEFKQALDKVIENSFPENQNEQIEGGEIFKSFAKKEEEQKEGDWERIYTDFSHALGLSIDDFYKLTMRQIDAIYEEISVKAHEEFRMNASIHGIKSNRIQGAKRRKKKSQFTKEDVATFKKMHQKLVDQCRIN